MDALGVGGWGWGPVTLLAQKVWVHSTFGENSRGLCKEHLAPEPPAPQSRPYFLRSLARGPAYYYRSIG